MEVHHHTHTVPMYFLHDDYHLKTEFDTMNNQTKYRIIKLLIYVLLGFAVAFLWHQMKK
jgi:hypothetical protein